MIDGADAIVWVESHISQAVCVFPVQPSARMVERFGQNRVNLWGDRVAVLELESALAAMTAAEGFTLAGGRTTSFTSGPGLAQSAAVLPAIAGKRLPLVVHVGARSLSTHAHNDSCSHDDVMGAADSGWGVLFGRSPQEAADLALIARRVAEDSETPFLNAQDGFLTTHTYENGLLPEPELMRAFIESPNHRIKKLFDPKAPLLTGSSQGDDSFMRGKIAQRFFYDRVCPFLDTAIQEFFALTGRRYGMVKQHRMEDAQFAFVGMGSLMLTVEAVVDYLRVQDVKAGCVSIVSLRPFPAAELAEALGRCHAVTVLDRMDAPLAGLNPLARELKAVFENTRTAWAPEIYSAVAGVGGQEVRPGHLLTAIENMRLARRSSIALGVKHPDAPEVTIDPDLRQTGVLSIGLHGVGVEKLAREIAAAAARMFGLNGRAVPKQTVERCGIPASAILTLSQRRVLVQCNPVIHECSLSKDIQSISMHKSGEPQSGFELPAESNGAETLGALLRIEGVMDRLGIAKEQLLAKLEPAALEAYNTALRVTGTDGTTSIQHESGETWRWKPKLSVSVDPLIPGGFCERIVSAYNHGHSSILKADLYSARGLMPPASAVYRSFRNLAVELPRLNAAACTGCMECVNQCPDSAISARVVEPEVLENKLKLVEREELRDHLRRQFARTEKFDGGLFGLFIDASKCKGCRECVAVCGDHKALSMIPKPEADLMRYDLGMDLLEHLPETPQRFIGGTSLGDMMLSSRANLYAGGAGSCAGCGEAVAIRMMLAACGFVFGAGETGVVAAAGCNTECGAAYPYNSYGVAWTNSLSGNAAADAMGIRLRWDQEGQRRRRLWVVGGGKEMSESASLSRLLASGMDIKILVLDQQPGLERGDGIEIAQIAMVSQRVFAAQTTTAHSNHFFRAVLDANEFPGPAVVVCYTPCGPHHSIAPGDAALNARLAVDSRMFPLMTFDPNRGESTPECLDLTGNPASKLAMDFYSFAHTQGRFANLGEEAVRRIEKGRMRNWNRLREMAGLPRE